MAVVTQSDYGSSTKPQMQTRPQYVAACTTKGEMLSRSAMTLTYQRMKFMNLSRAFRRSRLAIPFARPQPSTSDVVGTSSQTETTLHTRMKAAAWLPHSILKREILVVHCLPRDAKRAERADKRPHHGRRAADKRLARDDIRHQPRDPRGINEPLFTVP